MNIFNVLKSLIDAIFSGILGLGTGIFGLMALIMILATVIGPQHQKENFKSAFVVFIILFVIFLLIQTILAFVNGSVTGANAAGTIIMISKTMIT